MPLSKLLPLSVAMERHLWLNLADIGEEEKNSLLESPVLASKLFGKSVETVEVSGGEEVLR